MLKVVHIDTESLAYQKKVKEFAEQVVGPNMRRRAKEQAIKILKKHGIKLPAELPEPENTAS